MTAIAVFGDASASEKLIRASMNETLEAHLQFHPDEPFSLFIAEVPASPTLKAVVAWADETGVTYEMSATPLVAVDAAFNVGKPDARVLALIGDEEPTGNTAVALALAAKHSMEIRDLAEAGITYVYQEGVPPTTKENDVPAAPAVAEEESEYSWEEVGELADGGDDDAIALLVEAAEAIEVDPEAYETWADLAVDIQAAENGETEEDEDDSPEEVEDTPEEDKEDEPESAVGYTPADFKGKSLKDVRELARQSGIKDAARLGREDLIKKLCGEQGTVEDADLPQPPAPYGPESSLPPLSTETIDLIAEAVVAKLAARLA